MPPFIIHELGRYTIIPAKDTSPGVYIDCNDCEESIGWFESGTDVPTLVGAMLIHNGERHQP